MVTWLKYLQEIFGPSDMTVVLLFILFFGMQAIGELLEFMGKTVPEVLKIRKWFARRKKEREDMKKFAELIPQIQGFSATISNVQTLLGSVDAHYSADNIAMRDKWIEEVNSRLASAEKAQRASDKNIENLSQMLARNNEDTLAILIDSKRNTIIDFARLVIDESKPVTREQFHRVFKLHKEYEDLIERNKLTNGEVDVAIRIIRESYENHLRNGTFVEDIRGYNI